MTEESAYLQPRPGPGTISDARYWFFYRDKPRNPKPPEQGRSTDGESHSAHAPAKADDCRRAVGVVALCAIFNSSGFGRSEW